MERRQRANLGGVLAACGGICCAAWSFAQPVPGVAKRVDGEQAWGPSVILPSGSDAVVISLRPPDPRWPALASIGWVDHGTEELRTVAWARCWLSGGVRDDPRDRRRLAIGGRLLAQRYESVGGAELWSLDLATGVWSGLGQTIAGEMGGEPRMLIRGGTGDVVYFVAYDEAGRERLWRSDLDTGEAIAVLPAASAWAMAPLGEDTMVLGYALDDSGTALWRLQDHGPVSVVAWFPGAFPGSMLVAAEGGTEGAVEFAVSAPADTGEGTTVWRSDGTEQGTISLGTVPGRAELLGAAGGGGGGGGTRFLRTYINGGLHELWSLTPTAEGGSRRLAGPFEEIATWGWAAVADASTGRLVFTARGTAVGARSELWTSDGTREGTRWLGGPSLPALRDATVWCSEGGWVYLTAAEPLSGSEMWRTDGTEGGTVRLSDIAPGPTSSMPHGAAVVRHRLYFGAVDEGGVDGLWVVDLCPADFDNDGQVGVQDVLDFLAAYFAGSGRADVNRTDGVTLEDVVDFLTMWAAGC